MRVWLPLVALLSFSTAVASAAELDWETANEHSVIELITVDPDGDVRETKVWMAVFDGRGYVRTNDSRWFQNIERDPDLTLRLDDGDYPIRAEVRTDPALRERVDDVFREKYGWQVRVMEVFGGDGGDNLLGLSAR